MLHQFPSVSVLPDPGLKIYTLGNLLIILSYIEENDTFRTPIDFLVKLSGYSIGRPNDVSDPDLESSLPTPPTNRNPQ